MDNIVKSIKEKQGFVALSGATEDQIIKAESALGVKFSEEYKKYVSTFGIASFDGHELTGICASTRLNVVDVTLEERLQNPQLPTDWYVLEDLNIDDVLIWQSSEGKVYQSMPGAQPIELSCSLSEYLNL